MSRPGDCLSRHRQQGAVPMSPCVSAPGSAVTRSFHAARDRVAVAGGSPLTTRKWSHPVSRKIISRVCLLVGALGLFPLHGAEIDLALLRARAASGSGQALNELGNAYANGEGVPQDLPEAIRLYRLATEKDIA